MNPPPTKLLTNDRAMRWGLNSQTAALVGWRSGPAVRRYLMAYVYPAIGAAQAERSVRQVDLAGIANTVDGLFRNAYDVPGLYGNKGRLEAGSRSGSGRWGTSGSCG